MNWLEFLSNLFWPAVAMTALVMFRRPIARKIHEAEEVHFGKETRVLFSKTLENVRSPSEEEVADEIKRGSDAGPSLDVSSVNESAHVDTPFQLPMSEQYMKDLSEKSPAILVAESWRIIEAELERLSTKYNVHNTRDARAFSAIRHRLDHRIWMMFWIVRTQVQIRQLWTGARQASPEITPEQAREYAKEALRIAGILSEFESLVAKDLLKKEAD